VSKQRPGAGNRTERRGHRPRAAVLRHEGGPVLRLTPLTADEMTQVRAWAAQASPNALDAALSAARSLSGAIEDEQAARFDAADSAEDAAETRRILEELQ